MEKHTDDLVLVQHMLEFNAEIEGRNGQSYSATSSFVKDTYGSTGLDALDKSWSPELSVIFLWNLLMT